MWIRLINASYNEISNSNILDSNLYDFISSEDSLNNIVDMRINTTQISFEGLDISIRNVQDAPEDPKGWFFGVDKYLDIDNNSDNSWIFVQMSYDELGAVREGSLNLHSYDSLTGLWNLVPGSSANTAEDYVSANLTSFSTFGILGVIRPTRIVSDADFCFTGDFLYTSIHQAAADCSDGYRIIICPGTYTEENIIVGSNTVEIISYTNANETIVNSANGDIFKINAS